MPKVSIIIPCRNEEKRIEALLDSLRLQSFPVEQIEVVIADGMSTDDTRNIISSYCKNNPELAVRIIDNDKRIIPAALNVAIDASEGEFIVRMDAHSVPNIDYVKISVEELEKGLGTNVGGVWKIQSGDETWVAKSIAQATAHPLGVGGAKYRYTEKAEEVDTVPFGAFRKELIAEIGGFDESLLTNEDYEFNVRIREAGGKIWLNPAINCKYYARETFGKLAQQYWRYGFWKAIMLKRYPSTARPRQILPPVFVLGLISLLLLSGISSVFAYLLVAILGIYFLSLLIVGTQIAIKNKYAPYAIGVLISIMIMHFVWGTAFWFGLVSRK